MASCSGIELTGTSGSTNHQNAFPLAYRPHTQDGGAPQTSPDPEIQIERLALWDGFSEKLLQVNHADLGQFFLIETVMAGRVMVSPRHSASSMRSRYIHQYGFSVQQSTGIPQADP